MIRYYKACIAGERHIEANITCQDACHIVIREDGIAFAACADGVGSKRYADIGARIATERSVEYCAVNHHTDAKPDDKLVIMREAFWEAFADILAEAKTANNPYDQYNTTLCLAIFDGDNLWYGQSGDSGLVVLKQNGEYIPVTQQQRDEDGNVFPLRIGPTFWKIGKVDAPISGAMLMTDEVWDQIVPSLLRNEDVNINVALAKKFMDRIEDEPTQIATLKAAAGEYLKNYPHLLPDDDKTIVVLYNPEKPARRLDEKYYAPPDWYVLWERAYRQLYGGEEAQEG